MAFSMAHILHGSGLSVHQSTDPGNYELGIALMIEIPHGRTAIRRAAVSRIAVCGAPGGC